MKKVLIIIGIFVAFVAIATVSYTNIDSTKTYSMSFNDMKSVNGGDTMYENHICVNIGAYCGGGCTVLGKRECQYYGSGNVCIQFSGGEQVCTGPEGCYRFDLSSGCTSYPN